MIPEIVPAGDAVVARAGDVELFRYVVKPAATAFEGPKPYLHPVRTLAGDVVTAYRPNDHRWHKGIQMTATSAPCGTKNSSCKAPVSPKG